MERTFIWKGEMKMVKINFWQCPVCKRIDVSKVTDASTESIRFCPNCKAEKCTECGKEKLETRQRMKKVGITLLLDRC